MHDLVEEVVPLHGRDLRVLRPRDAESLLDEEAFEHEEFLPYWAELWPSARALAAAISGRALRGARTLELGCGLGLPSIAAALAGGRVLATDWSPEAVELTRTNAERNGASLETLVCSWTEPAPLLERAPWDLVLASDVLYEPRNGDALLGPAPAPDHGRVARRPWPQAGRAVPRRRPSRLADRVFELAPPPRRRDPPAQVCDTMRARVATPPRRRMRCGTLPSKRSASPSSSACTVPSRSTSTDPRAT